MPLGLKSHETGGNEHEQFTGKGHHSQTNARHIYSRGSLGTRRASSSGAQQLSSKGAVAMAKGSGYSGAGVVATAFLTIGPLNSKNCEILVVDLSDLSKTLGQEIDGVLGMSVLKEFEIVSVDLKHHKLVLK
jgi:predicted aspartyl protease